MQVLANSIKPSKKFRINTYHEKARAHECKYLKLCCGHLTATVKPPFPFFKKGKGVKEKHAVG